MKTVALFLVFAFACVIAQNCGCSGGECCSQYGWCGSTADYCDRAKGCQKDCWGDSNPTTKDNTPSTRVATGSETYVATRSFTKTETFSPKPTQGGNTTSGRVFIGYWADWGAYGNCALPSNKVPANKYTHINYAFASFDGNTGKLNDLDQNVVAGVMNLKKQNPNLKIMISLGGGSFSSGPWTSLINNGGASSNFYGSVKGWLDRYGFDGLDIDWEFPQNGEQDKVTNFFRQTRQAIGNGKLLTSAGPSGYFLPQYVPEKWIQYVDFINVMNYDYAGTWGGVTGSLAPLDQIANTMNTYVSRGVPANKLVYGLANYGYTWKVDGNNGLGVAAHTAGYAGPCANSAGYISATDIVKLRTTNKPSGFSEGWDNNGKMPYGTWGNQFATYETTDSIKYKTDFIKQKGYLGGMLWVMDADTTISDYIWAQLNN